MGLVPVFIIITDIYNDSIRLNINNIISYKALGKFTEIITNNGSISIPQQLEEFEEILKFKAIFI